MGYDRKAALEAERLYASIEARKKDLEKLTSTYRLFEVSVKISAYPMRKDGDYYSQQLVEIPMRAEGLLEEVRRFAMARASEAAISHIDSCNRRLAQLGFQKVEVKEGAA